MAPDESPRDLRPSGRRGLGRAFVATVFTLATLTAAAAAEPLSASRVVVWRREGNTHALEVDGAGFLWTAGDGGLCRFDGAAWSCPLTSCPGSLVVDKGGTVWGCARPSSDRDRTQVVSVRGTDLRHWVLPPVARNLRIIGTAGSDLLVGGEGGVWQWSAGGAARPLSTMRAWMAVRAPDALWIGNDQGVFRADQPTTAVLSGRANGLTASADGRTFAAMANLGVWELPRTAEDRPRLLPTTERETPPRSVQADPAHGVLWLAGTYNLNALAFGGTPLGSWGTREGLPHPVVHAIAEDTSQGLWLGTAQGVAQLRLDDPILTAGRAEGLPGDLAFSLSQGPDGSVWTTSTEGVARWNGRAFVGYGVGEPLGSNVRSVVAGPDGTVWVGGPGGLLVVKDGKLEPANVRQLPAGTGVHSMRQARDGSLLVGTTEGGVGRVRHGVWEEVLPSRAVGDTKPLNDLAEDRAGLLWLAAGGTKVGRWDGSHLEVVQLLPGQHYGLAVSIATDRDGGVWAGSNGSGLFHIKNGRVRHLTTAQGLWDDRVLGILEDDEGRLWMSSSRGIFRVDRSQLDALFAGWVDRITPVPYQVADGLRSNEGIIAYGAPTLKAADGALWFVSIAGLVRLDPRKLLAPAPLRSVVILGAEVDGRTTAATSATVHEGELRFRFVAPSLSQPSRVRYRHRLEGLQTDWSAPTAEPMAQLSAVPAGQYLFRVQAFSLDRPTATVEASFALTLVPPIFRRPWFVMTAALVFVLLGGNTWRLHRVRRARLEDAIAADRRRIAQDIHDSLEQDLTGLKMQVEAASAFLEDDPDRARTHLERAAELVGDGLVDTRNAVWGLRSTVLPSAELSSALELRLRRVVEPSGATLRFETQGPPRDLPSLVASQLVYILREAVTNAVKHAKPRTVEVTVDLRDADVIRIAVADDGLGLGTSATKRSFAGGMGLDGMRERVRRIGGTIDLRSPSTGGTVVSVEAPLPR